MLMWQWNFAFDTNLDEDKQAELGTILAKHIRDDLYPKEQDYFRVVCDSRVEQRSDFVRTFGGLFYLGILLTTSRSLKDSKTRQDSASCRRSE